MIKKRHHAVYTDNQMKKFTLYTGKRSTINRHTQKKEEEEEGMKATQKHTHTTERARD